MSGKFERKVLPVAMVLIGLLLLLACLCFAADGMPIEDDEVPGVVLLVKQQGEGRAVLQPVLPVQFAVEIAARGPDGAATAQGDAITCKAFKRVSGVFDLKDRTPAVVYELALDCGGRIYVIKGVLFSK